jgi:ATP-dependent exoDNAse (exonuclease V) alpha subunit
MYRAVLRAVVRARLPWVGWRPAGRGLFEIDGVPEEVLRQFSQRRVEIEERAAELAGVAAGGLSRERMQGVALATRRPKDSRVAQAVWRELARVRAAEHGFGKFETADLVRRPGRLSAELDLGVVVSRLSGSSGLTEMHNTFARRHALAEVARAFPGGATVAAVEAATVRYLADPSVRELDAAIGHEARFTTESLLMCERAIVDGAERRRNEQTATLPADVVARAIDRHQPVHNDGQAAAIHALTRAGHGVEVVSALAGTGKTTMIAALAQAYQDHGYRVIGTAPTARAARELRSGAGVPAGTMHALLAELDRTGQFSERTVLVIDEAAIPGNWRRCKPVAGWAPWTTVIRARGCVRSSARTTPPNAPRSKHFTTAIPRSISATNRAPSPCMPGSSRPSRHWSLSGTPRVKSTGAPTQ